MAVKREEIKSVKLSAKGILRSVNEDGFQIEDEKEGTMDIISLAEIRDLLLNKSISIAFMNKEDIEE